MISKLGRLVSSRRINPKLLRFAGSMILPSSAISGIIALAIPLACHAEPNPNIVFILADDMGYGDVSAYNPDSKISTPNIDGLARQGVRFTDAHSAATCVASRYELLTGRYLWRRPYAEEALIEVGRPTIASVLKKAGYATSLIGKWHLGFEGLGVHIDPTDYSKPLRGGPVDLGFDSYFGIPASLDVAPYFFIENDRVVQAATGTIIEHHSPGVRSIQGEFWRGGGIAPDFEHAEVLPRLADRALRYISDRANSKEPFFLYLALTAPHAPWLPTDSFRGKSGAGAYGDFVLQVDDIVGRVLIELERAGKTGNTMVIFTSDNGPTWYKEDTKKFGHHATGSWRGMKADTWEGGHRIPFIVRWPSKITAGNSSPQLISFTDLLATFASLTGQVLPADAGVDSIDILPALFGTSATSFRHSIIHDGAFPDVLAIREGNWKLIQSSCNVSGFEGFGHGDKETFADPCPNAPQPGGPLGQLYNLTSDPQERRNVYAENPDIVRRLAALLERERRKSHMTSP